MIGKLIFTTAHERHSVLSNNPEALAFTSDQISEMLRHIKAGGTAVVLMQFVNTGFRLPEGATVEFTDGCPKGGPERIQAERRVAMSHEHKWIEFAQFEFKDLDQELCGICGAQRHKPIGAEEWTEGRPPRPNKELAAFTDEALLMELRRRGRLGRISVELNVPLHYLDRGYSEERQIAQAWVDLAHKAAAEHIQGVVPTGAYVGPAALDDRHLERMHRVKFALNYAVDRPVSGILA